jgi:ADP-heptose:LPS heptosyltransferase
MSIVNTEDKKSAALKRAKNVLVIKFGSSASFVQSLAAAAVIREFHMGARVSLLTIDQHKALAEKAPYFDRVEADGKPREPQATAQLISRIRAAKYDLVYDLECTPRTNNYYLALRPWPPSWSGKAQGASHLFDADACAHLHPIERFHAQMRSAGLAEGDEAPMPDISWIRQALRDPPRLQPGFFGLRGPFVVIAPQGEAAAEETRWSIEGYAELARRMANRGVTPVMIGETAERDVAGAVARLEPRVKNLAGRADIFQVATLSERAGFVIGEDAPLMHVAAAAGASCLQLLPSGTDLARRAVRGNGGVVVLTGAPLSVLPVEQVDRALRNCGAYPAATA